MFRTAQSVRSITMSAARRRDLVQQAFVNKIKEYGQKGGDLAGSDPAVKKALQDELNRLAMKFNLASSDVVSKLPTNFAKPSVDSSVDQLLEGKTIADLVEDVEKEKKSFLAARQERLAKEAAKQAALKQ